jgi:hypothetical protein
MNILSRIALSERFFIAVVASLVAMSKGIHEMDPPLDGSALRSHNGWRGDSRHCTGGRCFRADVHDPTPGAARVRQGFTLLMFALDFLRVFLADLVFLSIDVTPVGCAPQK